MYKNKTNSYKDGDSMSAQEKLGYSQVVDRYEALRELSRDVAHDQFPSIMTNRKGVTVLKDAITLEGITLDCKKELRKWEKSGTRRVAWDWDTVTRKYKSHPKRFELSIWHKELFLCGATIGKPTSSGGKLRIDFIEASPISSPLSGLIVDIILVSGTAYARAIGAEQIRIMHPVNESVKNLYLSKPGFAYDQKGQFCYRDLK